MDGRHTSLLHDCSHECNFSKSSLRGRTSPACATFPLSMIDLLGIFCVPFVGTSSMQIAAAFACASSEDFGGTLCSDYRLQIGLQRLPSANCHDGEYICDRNAAI